MKAKADRTVFIQLIAMPFATETRIETIEKMQNCFQLHCPTFLVKQTKENIKWISEKSYWTDKSFIVSYYQILI